MTGPSRYDNRLADTMHKASESYRRRDDDGTKQWLEEAIGQAPWRTDLRFCLAGRHIQHGVPDEAIGVYEEVLGRIPGDVDALFFAAHWRRCVGDMATAEALREQLRAKRPDRAGALARIWAEIDEWKRKPVTDAAPSLSIPKRPAVLVLGLLLNEDGSMRPALVKRLEKTMEVLALHPGAAVVVSGGMPRADRVEAVAMREWLEERGVDSESIYEEGYSRDIVENLVFSRQILAALEVDGVVAVTCATNVRRTGAGLNILSGEYGLDWEIKVAAASGDTFDNFSDDGRDDLKLYRDTLRTYGIPMMTAYPYLAER